MAKQLQDWQRRHGLTQIAAAGVLGVPVQTYRNWMRGRSRVPSVVEGFCLYIDRHGVETNT